MHRIGPETSQTLHLTEPIHPVTYMAGSYNAAQHMIYPFFRFFFYPRSLKW